MASEVYEGRSDGVTILAPPPDGRIIQDTVELLREYYRESQSEQPRDAVMHLAMRTQLPEEFLFMTDRFSMAHSLEARVPFLDHLFVEAVMRIPAQIRTKPEDPKYLLRQAVRDLLPDDLLHALNQALAAASEGGAAALYGMFDDLDCSDPSFMRGSFAPMLKAGRTTTRRSGRPSCFSCGTICISNRH